MHTPNILAVLANSKISQLILCIYGLNILLIKKKNGGTEISKAIACVFLMLPIQGLAIVTFHKRNWCYQLQAHSINL